MPTRHSTTACIAIEAMKVITGVGEPLYNRVLQFDAMSLTFDEIPVMRDPGCPVCGKHPSVTELHDHEVHSTTCRLCMAGVTGRSPHWDTQFIPEDEDDDADTWTRPSSPTG